MTTPDIPDEIPDPPPSLVSILRSLDDELGSFSALVAVEREARNEHLDQVMAIEKKSRRRDFRILVAGVLIYMMLVGIYAHNEANSSCEHWNSVSTSIRQVVVAAIDEVGRQFDMDDRDVDQVITIVDARARKELPHRQCGGLF